MLLRRAKAPEVYLQKENEEGFNTLVKYIKDKLLNMELSGGNKKKKMVKKVSKKGSDLASKDKKQSNVAYQVGNILQKDILLTLEFDNLYDKFQSCYKNI